MCPCKGGIINFRYDYDDDEDFYSVNDKSLMFGTIGIKPSSHFVTFDHADSSIPGSTRGGISFLPAVVLQ